MVPSAQRIYLPYAHIFAAKTEICRGPAKFFAIFLPFPSKDPFPPPVFARETRRKVSV